MNSFQTRPRLWLLSFAAAAAACGGGGGGGGVGGGNTGPAATISGQLRVPAVAPATLASADLDRPMRPGEVVVWLEPGTAAADLAMDGFDLVRAGGPVAVYRAHAAAGKFSVRAGAEPADSVERATIDAATAMSTRAGVRCANPNYMVQPTRLPARPALPTPPAPPAGATVAPNDPFYSFQWHYEQIKLPQAWSITTGSPNVVVAVLDSGILSGHPDLDPARNVPGFDMISDPSISADGDGRDANPEDPGDEGTPQGSSFHGTHVAGTIGARSNNMLGVAGVDWSCKLMHVRVLGRGGGTIDDIVNGVLFAAGLANGSGQVPAARADIINMSLGAPGLIPVFEQACDAAAAAGCLLVAAAGNENSSELSSPEGFASVLSVGAVDLVRQRAPYSNFATSVDVWAPGGDGTADRNGDNEPDGVLSLKGTDQGAFIIDWEQGTSMASPHVAGVAALIKAVNPGLTASQLRGILTSSATTQPGVSLPNGGRIVDALLAVQAAGGTVNAPLLVATPNVVDFDDTTTTITIEIENRGTGNLMLVDSSTNPPAPWLDGTPADATPGNGLDADRIELRVDRTGLPNGVRQTVATLTYMDGATPVALDIPVRLQVGASREPNDTVFVLLVDPKTLETKFEGTTKSASNFAFSLAGVTSGEYLLVAGTDRDNDDVLGDDGELFGAWPDLDSPRPLTVVAGTNQNGLEFSAQIMAEIQSASLTPTRNLRGCKLARPQ